MKVTPRAEKQLRHNIKNNTRSSELAMRIIKFSPQENRLVFMLDREEEYDTVVNDQRGNKVLIVEQRIASLLRGKTLDYQEHHFKIVC